MDSAGLVIESLPVFRLIITRIVRPILAPETLIVNITIINGFVYIKQLPLLDSR